MPLPVIDVEQMRQWEAASWAAGVTETEVIARVGKAVAARAMALTKPGSSILVLAGKGHNGDDARACIPHLAERAVTLLNVLNGAETLAALPALQRQHALVIDGLFGIGLNRALSEEWRRLIEAINNLASPVLAIDVPSGWNATEGRSEGAAIQATLTLTVGAPKTGLTLGAAVDYVGRLEVLDDVGLVPCPHQSRVQWISSGDFNGFPPARKVAGHKGAFGHVAIFAGSLGYHGAAVMAGRAALRAQPGLVTLFTEPRVYLPVASQLQQVMVQPWSEQQSLPNSCTAIAFGPGLAAPDLSNELKEQLVSIWRESPLPVVADASALDWLTAGPAISTALRIITPHPGEAARLLKVTSSAVQQNRLATVMQLSAQFGDCLVVLKGHQTLVGRSSGEIYINSSGNPHLAQGGTGDVLLGYLAGLIAQPDLQSDALRTAQYAIWQHGAAADHLTSRSKNWVVEDLLQSVGAM